jgi:hypothetical protein
MFAVRVRRQLVHSEGKFIGQMPWYWADTAAVVSPLTQRLGECIGISSAIRQGWRDTTGRAPTLTVAWIVPFIWEETHCSHGGRLLSDATRYDDLATFLQAASNGRQTCRFLKLISLVTSDSPWSEQIPYKLELASSANVEEKYRLALLCDRWKRNQIACESMCYLGTKFVIGCADILSSSIRRFLTWLRAADFLNTAHKSITGRETFL